MGSSVFDSAAIGARLRQLRGDDPSGRRFTADARAMCAVSSGPKEDCPCTQCVADRRTAAMRRLRDPAARIAYLQAEEPPEVFVPIKAKTMQTPDRIIVDDPMTEIAITAGAAETLAAIDKIRKNIFEAFFTKPFRREAVIDTERSLNCQCARCVAGRSAMTRFEESLLPKVSGVVRRPMPHDLRVPCGEVGCGTCGKFLFNQFFAGSATVSIYSQLTRDTPLRSAVIYAHPETGRPSYAIVAGEVNAEGLGLLVFEDGAWLTAGAIEAQAPRRAD